MAFRYLIVVAPIMLNKATSSNNVFYVCFHWLFIYVFIQKKCLGHVGMGWGFSTVYRLFKKKDISISQIICLMLLEKQAIQTISSQLHVDKNEVYKRWTYLPINVPIMLNKATSPKRRVVVFVWMCRLIIINQFILPMLLEKQAIQPICS